MNKTVEKVLLFVIPMVLLVGVIGCGSARPGTFKECGGKVGLGALIGGAAGLLLADEVSGDSTSNAERILATVGGAAIGGGVAYALCERAYRQKYDLEARFKELEAQMAQQALDAAADSDGGVTTAADNTAAGSDINQPVVSPLHDVVQVVEQRVVFLNLNTEVMFDVGKSSLKPAYVPYLDAIAASVMENEVEKVVLVGYTDSTGSLATNERLSKERAKNVADHMIAQGIPANLVEHNGKGPSDPVADNSTPEGRAKNRRVEVLIMPKVPTEEEASL